MNEAATVLNVPTSMTLDGQTYELHHVGFKEHGEVQRWLDRQIRDPLEIVDRSISSGVAGNWPIEMQKYAVRAAIEIAARSRILLGSHEADALLDTIEGQAFMLYLAIRKGDKDFTVDKAMDLLGKMDQVERMRAQDAADVLRADGPKAPGPDGTTTRPPTSGSTSPSTGGTSSIG